MMLCPNSQLPKAIRRVHTWRQFPTIHTICFVTSLVFKWKVIPSGNSNSNEAWSQKGKCEQKLKYKKKERKKAGKSNQRNELIKRGMVFVQGNRGGRQDSGVKVMK